MSDYFFRLSPLIFFILIYSPTFASLLTAKSRQELKIFAVTRNVFMKAPDTSRPDRTNNIRTKIAPIGVQGLLIEQDNRKKATGKRARLTDIAADWLEDRAAQVISAKLQG